MSRTTEFMRNERYETLLQDLNARLERVWLPGDTPQLPVVLIQGVPRSGTTVLYQLLSRTGGFTYPTNLVARFYRNPGLGWMIQGLVEPFLSHQDLPLQSRAGLTEGWWQPHEFGYFWRHHLGIHDHHEPDAPDLAELVVRLAQLEHAGGRPLLLKNGILSYSTPVLEAALPTLKVIRLTRDPVEVADSILRMRERYTGDAANWWSVRPADISSVEHASPEAQVAFQVRHCRDALDVIEPIVDVDYAGLCADPRGTLGTIADAIGIRLDLDGVPEQLTPSLTHDRARWEPYFA